MRYYAVTTLPEKTAPLPKNRAGVFSPSALIRARLIPSQPLELQPENRPTLTETASGVRYYGHRFYSPEMGWISRDPIEEAGGMHLYSYVINAPINAVDPVGQSIYDIPVKKEYDTPANWAKCKIIKAIISGGSQLDPVDRRLWDAWLTGIGNPGVTFDEFDTGGVRAEMEARLALMAQNGGRSTASGLPCGGTQVVASGTRDPEYFGSSHRMISTWLYTLRYLVIAEKKCKPCCELSVKVKWRHKAFDTTNFNDGLNNNGVPYTFEGGGFRIYDRLVNECNEKYNWGAKDFDISAEEEGDKAYSWPCGN